MPQGLAERRSSAIVALLLLVPAPTLGTICALWLEITDGPIGQTLYGMAKIWILVWPLIWLRWVAGGKWSLSPARRGGFFVGATLGIAISACIFVAWLALGDHIIDPETVREAAARNALDNRLRYLTLAVYMVVINALLEEYVWRWFVFQRCRALVGPLAAVMLASAFFTAHHVLVLSAQFSWPVVVLGSIGVFTGGVVWTWCYLRFQSIWPGYVSHAIVDIAVLTVGWLIIFGGDA